MTNRDFEEWKATLTEDKVITFLNSWEEKGFKIIQGKHPLTNGWTVFDDSNVIFGIRPYDNNQNLWSICIPPIMRRHKEVGTLEELKQITNHIYKSNKLKIHRQPKPTVQETKINIHGDVHNSNIQQGHMHANQQINVKKDSDPTTKGRAIGIFCLVLSAIFLFISLNSGWNLSGQIFGVFSIILFILGIASLKSPKIWGPVAELFLKYFRN